MLSNASAVRLRGRKDQGNQFYRRMEQLQALEQRSGGAFKYVDYDRDRNLYQVQVAQLPPLYLRSGDIDPFVAGMECGVLTDGQLPPAASAEWRNQTLAAPVARLESLEQLDDPAPQASAEPGQPQPGPGGEPVTPGQLHVHWAAVPGADRYTLEVRDTALHTPVWREAATATDTEAAVPVRTWGTGWQVRVRAEDTTGRHAMSNWAVATATPTQ